MSGKIELGEPDVIRNEDNILWLRKEIERLTRQRDEQGRNACELFDTVKSLQAEIERLRVSFREANDELGHYKKRNAKLQAVVDAAREIVEGPHKNWPKLREALEALEGGDE